jgi:hypothetical protein
MPLDFKARAEPRLTGPEETPDATAGCLVQSIRPEETPRVSGRSGG